MKIRKRIHIIITAVVVTTMLTVGCSTEKNTSQSRWWHSFNARYNTYYNGAMAYVDGSLEKENGNKDNYTDIIPLYTVGNKSSRDLGQANFDRAIEKSKKAIKMHSIKKRPQWTKNRKKTERDIEWLNRKEYNPFLWKAWMLMGRSQFMKGSFDEAASTFAYMSRLYSTQPAIYGRARAWLAKCYVEQDWFYDAEDVMTKIRRDSIHWRARKEWDYTYADYYIRTGRYKEAVPYLRKVIRHEMRRKQKAREWYLMGQIQTALGNKVEAYKAYKRVLRLHPPYELEFNARISMTEVMAAGQSKKMIRRLKRMAASDNNKEYLDQVYYAIGNIYMTEKDTANAIKAYEKGNVGSTRNGLEKGVLLLTLGDIYWNMEKYSDARRCYGEAIGLMDKERKDYNQLSERSKILDELVPYTDAIHLQDSLQALAVMSESERNKAIDRVIDALKKKEKEERAAQLEAEALQNAGDNTLDNPLVNQGNKPGVGQDKSSTWYFYNPMAVSRGRETFQKLWGKRENVDDWQRVNKTVVALTPSLDELTDEQRDSLAAVEAMADSLENVMDSAQNDPHKREYYLKQIPFTPEQIAESNKIIEDGLFNSGVIFKDKLDNLALGEKSLRRLTDNYKEYEKTDEAYYHLFLLYSRRGDSLMARSFLDKLKAEFPDSRWTTLLTDPYFEENAKYGVHIEDSLYASTYEAFKADRFDEVKRNTEASASRFPLGANRDKFVFIGGLSKLNNGDAEGCVADMEVVVKEYPNSDVSGMAGMIINGVKAGRRLHGGKFDIGDVWSHRSVVLNEKDSVAERKFVAERDVPFSFIIAYSPDSLDENRMLFELARFNFTNFVVRNFDITIETFDGLNRMKTSGFKSYDEALQYARQMYKNKAIMSLARNGRAIIISDANLELLGTHYSYNDYDAFYEKHFVPLKISTVRLLTEPAEIEYERRDGDGQSDGDELYNGGVIEEGLFVEDEELEPEQSSTTIVVEDEQPADSITNNVEDGTFIVPADSNQPTDSTTVAPESNTIVVPTDGNQPTESTTVAPESNEIFVPIEEEKPAESNAPAEETDAVVVPMDEEPIKETPKNTVVEEKPEKAIEPEQTVEKPVETKPVTITPPVSNEPEKTETQDPVQEQPATDSNDELIIEFDDGFGTTGNNNNVKPKEDKRQNSYDLEDEYYDLEGF